MDLANQPLWLLFAVALSSCALGVWLANKRTQSLRKECTRLFAIQSQAAQSINDSLLQGFLGIAWQMEAAATLLPANPLDSKVRMAAVLEQMDQLLQEARQELWDLKQNPWIYEDFLQGITRHAENLSRSAVMKHNFEILGDKREVNGEVAHSLGFIARELWTAIQRRSPHASIRTKIDYRPDGLWIAVHDLDWRPDPPPRASSDEAWNTPAIRRRARHIGAHIAISFSPAEGRSMILSVPAALAYVGEPRAGWWSRLRGRSLLSQVSR